MSDQDILDAIARITSETERLWLRAQFERHGRGAVFWDAIITAMVRQHLETPSSERWELLGRLEQARTEAG